MLSHYTAFNMQFTFVNPVRNSIKYFIPVTICGYLNSSFSGILFEIDIILVNISLEGGKESISLAVEGANDVCNPKILYSTAK